MIVRHQKTQSLAGVFARTSAHARRPVRDRLRSGIFGHDLIHSFDKTRGIIHRVDRDGKGLRNARVHAAVGRAAIVPQPHRDRGRAVRVHRQGVGQSSGRRDRGLSRKQTRVVVLHQKSHGLPGVLAQPGTQTRRPVRHALRTGIFGDDLIHPFDKARRLVQVEHRDDKTLLILQGRRAVVLDHNREGDLLPRVRRSRSPVNLAGRGVDQGLDGRARGQAEGQGVRRHIRIGRASAANVELVRGHSLGRRDRHRRRAVRFRHLHRHRAAATQRRLSVIRHFDGNGVSPGPLPFGRRPGQLPGRGLDRHSGRRIGAQPERQTIDRQVCIHRRYGETPVLFFLRRLCLERGQDRRTVDLLDRHGQVAGGRQRRTPIVLHLDSNRVNAWTLPLGRRPREETGGPVDLRSRRGAGAQPITQDVGWHIAVRPVERNREGLAFLNLLLRGPAQGRRVVDLPDLNGEGARRAQRRNAIIRHPQPDGVSAGSVVFTRRPRDGARARLNRHSVWRGCQSVGQSVRGQIQVGRGRGHIQRAAFTDRLIRDHGQHRLAVQFLHRDDEAPSRAEIGAAVVGHPDRDRVGARALRFRGRPTELSGDGVDRRAGRRAGLEAKSQRIRRQIHVTGRGREAQSRFLAQRRAVQRRQHRRVVHRQHRQNEALLHAPAVAVSHGQRRGRSPELVGKRRDRDGAIRSGALKHQPGRGNQGRIGGNGGHDEFGRRRFHVRNAEHDGRRGRVLVNGLIAQLGQQRQVID